MLSNNFMPHSTDGEGIICRLELLDLLGYQVRWKKLPDVMKQCGKCDLAEISISEFSHRYAKK